MKVQSLIIAAIAVSVSAVTSDEALKAVLGDPIEDLKAGAVNSGCYDAEANTLECLEKLLINSVNTKFTELKPLLNLSPAASHVATIDTLLATATTEVEACYGEADCAATAACNAGYNTEGLAADFQVDFVEPIVACCGTEDVQTCTESAIDAGIVAASGNVKEAAIEADARK
ncbi:hypothetical protein SARC_05206 [Sphaeroforma arctica JP610]|uniref:Saposin B-type domain-containing protein n=1 Tax=Sphaeroforma arctica JP610 TaxID=667725 RepID=A0A0L0G107_9EUKA|nr:hypothetical protein SARC_05206 [Sphaeroforma arctica JP610]KNC82506.1 hypothetical protein SARC_05206 [Sphaeroforma arctica JP610]|eukprot:XP_014156408.1 hypothetical protein SARC_05206 [Sphaeroforma arctica JP610]